MAGLKICGVTHIDDARACVAVGVEAIGLNFWPRSKRFVTPAQGGPIARAIGGSAQRVGVFVDAPVPVVAETATALGLDAIQMHGDADPAPYAALGIPWVWVVRTRVDPGALRVPDIVPAWVLLDAEVAGYGGQGVVADWDWAAAVVRALAPLPVWLAGGLHPGNAALARSTVRPAGLDVASGAERPGTSPPRKDRSKLEALAKICAFNADDPMR